MGLENGISVVIPVKNGAATLRKCLSSILMQSVAACTEIIILDSMSTDGSREIASEFGAKIIDIPHGQFDHGLTRNIGVQSANGKYIYLTVQDAWIEKHDMLEKMSRHFIDHTVMAVVGHQAVPHEKDKNPSLWFSPFSDPEVIEKYVDKGVTLEDLPLNEQQSLIAWDDVVAMYRRMALIEQPFVQTAYAEDWVWSFMALKKGWKLLYDSSLIVYHYHHHDFRFTFNLAYTVNYHFYKFFCFKPAVPSVILPLLKASYHLLKNKRLSVKEKLYWIGHNFSSKMANFISTIDFLTRLNALGERSIEVGYKKYCKTIPLGKQK